MHFAWTQVGPSHFSAHILSAALLVTQRKRRSLAAFKALLHLPLTSACLSDLDPSWAAPRPTLLQRHALASFLESAGLCLPRPSPFACAPLGLLFLQGAAAWAWLKHHHLGEEFLVHATEN